jgi:hypothetical protein
MPARSLSKLYTGTAFSRTPPALLAPGLGGLWMLRNGEVSEDGEGNFLYLRLCGVGWVPDWVLPSLLPIERSAVPICNVCWLKEGKPEKLDTGRLNKYPALCAEYYGI